MSWLAEQVVLDNEPLNFTEISLLKFHVKNAVNKKMNALFQQCHLQTQGMHITPKIFGSSRIKYQNCK